MALRLALCSLLAVAGIVIAANLDPPGSPDPDRLMTIAVLVGGGLVVGLPLIQVVASVALVLLIAINWPFRFPDRRTALKRIGWITGASLVGAAVGATIMVVVPMARRAASGLPSRRSRTRGAIDALEASDGRRCTAGSRNLSSACLGDQFA